MAEHHWSYDKTGPNYWPEEYSACGGKAQSPINIQTSKVTKVWVSYSVFSHVISVATYLMSSASHLFGRIKF